MIPGKEGPATSRLSSESSGPVLPRRLDVSDATAVNMSNMVGIGPFITVPIILATLGAPHS